MTPGLELYLRIATDVLFVVIGWQAFVHYLHFRDREHLYFAVFCGMLAVSTLFSELALVNARQSSTEGRLFGIALTALPMLILLLAATVRPLPRWVIRTALVSFGYIVAVLLLTDWRDPRTLWLYIIAAGLYIGMQTFGAAAFWHESRRAVGMTRNRYVAIFVGCVLLIAIVGMLLWFAFIPGVTPSIYSLYVVASALMACMFVIGFEPPGFVRKAWQSAQLAAYQTKIISRLINKPADRILRHLAATSLRAVGGQAVLLASYDTAEMRLSLDGLREAVSFVIPMDELDQFGRLLAQFDPQPRYLRRSDVPDTLVAACMMDGYTAGAIFIVPVVNLPHALTMLIITMRSGTLFIAEDLAILTRFAEHARAILENNSLISAAQNLVEELRDETGDLEDMVLEREKALQASEGELRRRLVQMSALYRELEGFSTSVSHDLRSPLRAIGGFANALAEDYGALLPAEGMTYIERIKANSVKMEQLMNDMLKLSKLSRSDIAPAHIDLTDAAVRIGHELRAQNPARDVAFSVEAGLTATADPVLVSVLLTNLLGNAWKFTAHAPEPKISFTSVVIEGDRVFRVSDNGAGFDMTYGDKLFKPFQRLHTDKEFEGSGIGLAMVQRIVNRHGGRVWAEGAPGGGARFYFTLPERMT